MAARNIISCYGPLRARNLGSVPAFYDLVTLIAIAYFELAYFVTLFNACICLSWLMKWYHLCECLVAHLEFVAYVVGSGVLVCLHCKHVLAWAWRASKWVCPHTSYHVHEAALCRSAKTLTSNPRPRKEAPYHPERSYSLNPNSQALNLNRW